MLLLLYNRASKEVLNTNLELIFKFLLQGEIYEIDLQKEKKVIANEKISRKFDNIRYYQDELNKLVWRGIVNTDILGDNLNSISLNDVQSVLSELTKREYMSIYYATSDISKSEIFFSNLINKKNKIFEKQFNIEKPILSDLFLSGNRSKEIEGNPATMVSIIYMLDEKIEERASIILSLISLALVNGTSGYLFDKLRNNSYNLYFIIAKTYFQYSYPFLEIQYIYSSKEENNIKSLNNLIIELIQAKSLENYIKNNITKLKKNLLEIIEYQVSSNTMKSFLMFLAKEHQIGRDNMNLNNTKSIIYSINEEEIISLLNQMVDRECSQIALI
ncbi:MULTISPECIES: insulinase family protein [unclassified Gemella]|uniref:insulinase family protein n=1 Tax=unclassified Gemella TaxID=2624949 RepID=UPI0015CFE3EE|nr:MULTISPECIES: insulinase family protein [unclassified Gemella]MBF0710685.1 insulinase family protein [Gemella sp. GL1.1]NYS28029.1 insulinase family protein [Gemella sp. GL1]